MGSVEGEGLLLVDKPAGMTSHDVVVIARRALGERRIGHLGTLDPFATGLLVLLVGRTTRLAPYLEGEPKVYDATVRFGSETDTDDLTGAVVREMAPPDARAVDAAIAQLTGELEQMPPAYSAKKIGGRRAYALARRGDAPVLRPTRVSVRRWEVRARRPDELDATIVCSGGTYLRALARDLGRLAGSTAHLTVLRRLRSGPLDVRDAMSIDALRHGAPVLRSPLEALALAIDELDERDVARIMHGLTVAAKVAGGRAALVDADRAIVAIAERAGTAWQPRVVLRAQ